MGAVSTAPTVEAVSEEASLPSAAFNLPTEDFCDGMNVNMLELLLPSSCTPSSLIELIVADDAVFSCTSCFEALLLSLEITVAALANEEARDKAESFVNAVALLPSLLNLPVRSAFGLKLGPSFIRAFISSP